MKNIYSFPLFFFLIAVFFSWNLQAQVYVKSDATGNSDGTSWDNAYESVDKALANITSGEIWIAAGTYKPGGTTPDLNSTFNIAENIALYGGFNGTETELSQRDPATNETILSGDLDDDDIQNDFTVNKSDNVLHVIYVESDLTDVVIDGFSIIGGHTLDDSMLDLDQRAGGGIYSESPVTINQCSFYNNFGRSGACVYLLTSTSGSSINNSSFSWNSASSQSAGVMVNEVDGFSISNCTFSNNQVVRGAFYALRSNAVEMENCTFSFNTNITGPGGAIWNFASTNVNITNSTFSDNRANNSGAIYYSGGDLMNADDVDNFVLTNCTFSDNQATSGIGGAFRNSRGSYTLDGCTFLNNSSTGSGGHIRNDTDGDEVVYKNCRFEGGSSGGWGGAHTCYGEGTYTVTDCEYINNSCSNLGGAVNSGLNATSVNFDNCTFSGNSSLTASGGALFIQNDSLATDLTVTNCDFENNMASNGGGAIGVDESQSTVVENCNFLFNIAGGFGGAINLSEDEEDVSTLDILNSTFILNQSGSQGGAVSVVDANTSIVSCLFGENSALSPGTGGALSLNASDTSTVSVSILNCTIAKNTGDLAAGIAQWTGTSEAFLNTTIQNSILFNSGGNNYAIEGGTPALISNGGNMSSDATLETYFTNTNDLNNVEPTLVDPDIFDYNLTTNSPGIDAAVLAGTPEFDILGNPRVNLPDMGAFENQEVTSTKETIEENDGVLLVSPNPVRGSTAMAVLKNDWTGALRVTVTDYKGQVVEVLDIEKSVGEMNFQVPLTNLAKGVYQLTVSNGDVMVVERLIRL
ncbi:MAG: right-handed parallel beta-helix repeat-containing protein [Bacteroidota bacterium]